MDEKNPKYFNAIRMGYIGTQQKSALTSSSKMATTTTTLYQSIEPEIKDISLLAKGTFNYGGFFSSASSSGANAQPEIRELGERVFSQIRAVARHTNEREWFSEHEVMSEGFFFFFFHRFCVLTRWFFQKALWKVRERETDGRNSCLSRVKFVGLMGVQREADANARDSRKSLSNASEVKNASNKTDFFLSHSLFLNTGRVKFVSLRDNERGIFGDVRARLVGSGEAGPSGVRAQEPFGGVFAKSVASAGDVFGGARVYMGGSVEVRGGVDGE